MARPEDFLETLRPQLQALDDDALAIATSKGLVRRAQKELEKGVEPEMQMSGDRFTLTLLDHTVTFPASNLLEATCTCPAADICRHILVGCLWLRTQLPTTPASDASDSVESEAPSPPPDVPAYSLDDLTTWASKSTLRDGFAFFDRESYEIDVADPIIVRFPNANITCRYGSATGLTGMLCSCKPRQVCQHQVATVLAILLNQGMTLSPPEATSAVEFDAAAAAQAIATAQTRLEQTVAIGLLHLSDITHQQFVTLAVSAQGAKLPRLALALRSIASDIDLQLKRDATADSDRLFARMAYTYALCAALQQAAPAYPLYLTGQAQSRYDDVGILELVGMGAYPWQTQSGYAGLTVIFWDKATQQWCSWSESRPMFHRQHFNPNRAYRQPGPWEGIANPAEASQSFLRLVNARRNYQQRLSTSSQTVGFTLRTTQPNDWQSIRLCFEDWEALHHHIASTRPIGLAESSPLDHWVLIQPHQWGPRQFDKVTQQFTWMLFDPDDRPLMLRIPFASTSAKALEKLERLEREEVNGAGIVGSVYLERDAIYCHPIALCRHPKPGQSAILNLYFSSSEEEPSGAIAPDLASEPTTTDAELDSASLTSIEFLITTLQRLAEKGIGVLREDIYQDLSRLAGYFEKVGMTTLEAAIRDLMQPGQQPASQLLKTRYLCRLYSWDQSSEFKA